MKFSLLTVMMLGAGLLIAPMVHADPVDQLLKEYQAQGANTFDAAAAARMWTREFRDAKSGRNRSCTSCHDQDLARPGKHAKTGKPIEPMAPSVNPQRLTDIKKIRKWLRRNCKWTLGRECSAQEKGDLLTWLRTR